MSKVKNRGAHVRSVRVLTPYVETITEAESHFNQQMTKVRDISPWRNMSEKAWTVMLVKQGIVSRKNGKKILKGILGIEKAQSGEATSIMSLPTHSFALFSVEKILCDIIGEGVAGDVNVGKTLSEPIARLQIRDKIIDVLYRTRAFQKNLLDVAAKNTDAVMVGYTHLAQAQATALGHYLILVHDTPKEITGAN